MFRHMHFIFQLKWLVNTQPFTDKNSMSRKLEALPPSCQSYALTKFYGYYTDKRVSNRINPGILSLRRSPKHVSSLNILVLDPLSKIWHQMFSVLECQIHSMNMKWHFFRDKITRFNTATYINKHIHRINLSSFL